MLHHRCNIDVVSESLQTCAHLHEIMGDFASKNCTHGRTISDSL